MEKVNCIAAARLIIEAKRVFIITSPDIPSLYNKYQCTFVMHRPWGALIPDFIPERLTIAVLITQV